MVSTVAECNKTTTVFDSLIIQKIGSTRNIRSCEQKFFLHWSSYSLSALAAIPAKQEIWRVEDVNRQNWNHRLIMQNRNRTTFANPLLLIACWGRGKVFALGAAKRLNMKKNPFVYGSLLLLVSFLSSCEVIGGIFKAGVWVGILIVVVIIGLVVWLIGRGRG